MVRWKSGERVIRRTIIFARLFGTLLAGNFANVA